MTIHNNKKTLRTTYKITWTDPITKLTCNSTWSNVEAAMKFAKYLNNKHISTHLTKEFNK